VIGKREGMTIDVNSSGTDWEKDIKNYKFRERWDGRVHDEKAFVKNGPHATLALRLVELEAEVAEEAAAAEEARKAAEEAANSNPPSGTEVPLISTSSIPKE
jgi:hypothetical protein